MWSGRRRKRVISVLMDSGHVYRTAPGEQGSPLRLERVDVPSIRRLHRGFLEDMEGRIWYVGAVMNQFRNNTLPRGLLSPGTPEYTCGWTPKGYSSCVGPVELPALRNTRPALFFLEVLAIMPDGSVRCWTHPDEGNACKPF